MDRKAKVITGSSKEVESRAGVESNTSAVIATLARSASSDTSLNANDTSGQLAQLGRALTDCASQFSSLGSWIKKQVEENMETLMDGLALDVPKMYEEFKRLSPLMKVFLMVGLFAVLFLIRWMTWELISFIWPHILEFIGSETGQSIMSGATDFLTGLNQSSVISTFSTVFASAAAFHSNEGAPQPLSATGDDDEAPCFTLSMWSSVSQHPLAAPLLSMLRKFFEWLMQKLALHQS